METLSLFPRCNIDNETNGDINNAHVDGYVLFPLDGSIIKYLSGEQLLHCSLSNTLHLSDSSRNTYNWSRVHGPYKINKVSQLQFIRIKSNIYL